MIDVVLPALSPTMETGNLTAWLKNEGDAIAVGDALAEVETDKAAVEIAAASAGVLAKIVVPAGTQNVRVNAVIARIDAGNGAVTLAPPATAAPAPTTAAVPVRPRQPAERLVASPIARRLARETGIDLRRIAGSGPGGRIVERDVAGATAAPAAGGAATVELRIICEVTELESMRARVNAAPASDGDAAELGLVDFVVKALALALARSPVGAAPDAPAIVVAFLAADGAATVVVQAAATKSVLTIAHERARPSGEGGEAIATVTDYGAFGIASASAFVEPPQRVAVAVGALDSARVTLTLAADRRALDGFAAARLLADMKATLEAPVRLLLGGP